jgi:hypothetical protein
MYMPILTSFFLHKTTLQFDKDVERRGGKIRQRRKRMNISGFALQNSLSLARFNEFRRL